MCGAVCLLFGAEEIWEGRPRQSGLKGREFSSRQARRQARRCASYTLAHDLLLALCGCWGAVCCVHRGRAGQVAPRGVVVVVQMPPRWCRSAMRVCTPF